MKYNENRLEVKINEHESYTIIMPSVVDRQQLLGLLDKLNSIAKILSKADIFANNVSLPNEDDETTEEDTEPIQQRTPRKPYNKNPIYSNTRENFIKTLKMHYFKNRAEKNNQARKWGYSSWNEIVKNFHTRKRTYKINAREIGLRRFPNRLDIHRMEEFVRENRI